jgi:RimJ/RimL family protein N-acetyltransferase
MPIPELPIRTERLELRAFVPKDLDALFRYQSDAEVTRYLYWGPNDLAESRASLDRKMGFTELREGGDALALAVVLRETGELVGDVMLMWTSEEHRQGEVGYVFDPAFAGRGYATEAAREMLRVGFEELGLHRIVGRLGELNKPSARLLERLGMRLEARLVEDQFLDGVWSTQAIYAMLEREWRASASE